MSETQSENTDKPRTSVGRKPIIKDAIPAFVDALKGEVDDYAELWEREWAKFSDTAVTTRNQYTSRYRNAVRDKFGRNHPSLAFIKVLDRTDDPLRTVETRGSVGRKATRAERITAFGDAAVLLNTRQLEAIQGGKTEAQAGAVYKRGLAKIWNAELEQMIATLSNNTIVTQTSAYRNELKNRGLDDDVTMSIVTTPEEIQKKRNEQYQANIIERHSTLVAFPFWRDIVDAATAILPATDATFGDLEQAAKKAAEGLSREQAVRIGVALGILTGRRPFEIFCQGNFAPAPLEGSTSEHSRVRGYETWRVLFHGQAKTRGREGTRFDEQFPIPVLAKARDIVFALYVIRATESGSIWARMSNEEFKADLLRTPNPRCIYPMIRSEVFADYWPKPAAKDTPTEIDAKRISSHNVRSLYAEIADQYFRPKSMTKIAFMARALGHTEDDLATATSYMKYHLPDHKDAGASKRVKKALVQKLEREVEEFGHT